MIGITSQHFNLTAIIVSWNTKDLLRQCVSAVFSSLEQLSFQVVVVDNASKDGSVEMLRESFPDVLLIENKENVGFARANNQAFKLAGNSKCVLLLNSDAILRSETIKTMLEFMETNEKAGAVAPALCYPDGGFQPGGGYIPSLQTAFNYFFFLSVLFPRTYRGLFVDQRKVKLLGKPIRIDWVAGTCMLVRKEVIDSTGGFDESYFMYAEDAEWCGRIRKGGWDIYYLPYVEIVHYHGASTKDVSDRWLKALIAYMRAEKGVVQTLLFRLIAAGGFLLRSVFYFLASLFTQRKELMQRAYQMYILSRGFLDLGKN